MDLGTRTWRHFGLLRLAVLVPLLCPPGLFKCEMSCRVAPPAAANPKVASTCCDASGAARELAREACHDHSGASEQGLKPGCCCPADAQAAAGSLPRRVSESSQPGSAAADAAPAAFHSASEMLLVDAALTGYSPPGPGSQDTYLRIVNLRI
jgi:hypothetical protein